MAKVCGAKVEFYVLFFVYLSYCYSFKFESKDEIKEYGFVREEHYREKRDLTNVLPQIPQNAQNITASMPPVVASAATTSQNGTTLVKVALNRTTTDVKQEPPGLVVSINGTLNASSRPLLGVNGTGQRIDYPKTTTTAKPVVISVSSEMPPLKSPKKPKKDPLSAKPWSDDDIIDTIDVPDQDTEEELKTKYNITKFNADYHLYYNSSIIIDENLVKEYWKHFKDIPVNNMLSKSHRRAMTVKLSFDFPFYGHPVRNVTVASGGFLYTGEYVHSWLAATQYIAPLMANFDTRLSNDSYVKFLDNGTAFTVIWENVALLDRQEVGNFTFSATLHKNGDIVFTYFSVPIRIETIQDDQHPVKVGLSDAYIIDKVIYFSRRKTIYEYHRVNFGSQDIRNGTIIYLTALPTCLKYKDCMSCLTQDTQFTCTWCPTLNKCSTGTDRKRQDWIYKGCDRIQITNMTTCPAIGEKGNNAAKESETESPESDTLHGRYYPDKDSGERSVLDKTVITTYDKARSAASSQKSDINNLEEESKSSVGIVLGLMIPVCLIMSALIWILYAYRNPHTKSGQLLIQYRPSQWTWRRGEARYTAATIHM